MSAAPAHAPSAHPTAPSAAPSAAPVVAANNNAMHFNHGGVLGLTESIARLVKGVTYDAAVDTFAHPANNPNMGAAPASHPAPHPAPHPTPAGAPAPDGAHPAPHPAPAATDGAHPAPHPAPTAGHDDDDDDSISGSIIKGLSHMGHYGMAFPVLAQGLKWAKNKMFPEIHEIPTEDQHVGDQILHKLKKNKKNKTELDHHALEGFCKGLDIANLNRTFRMFTDPARFALAVDREPGREEIKKEIANILDLSGDVDLKEVEDQTNRLLHLLGHHVDSRVEPQRKHLVDIINNVKAWLTKDTLKDIYEPKAKEGNFKIDFEHFGDMLLEEVTPENRDRYLRSIKPSTFPATFKAKFPYLTNPGALAIALKKEPEREKVLTQLRQFTGVDYAMDDKALEEHIKALQGRVGTAPADVDGPIIPPATKPSKVKGPLYDEYKAFEAALALVKTTMTAPVLSDLFEGKTETKEQEYDMDYTKIGDKVLKLKGETLIPFLKRVKKDGWDDMENEIGNLLTADRVKEEAEDNPDKLREQIQNLFSLNGKITEGSLKARVAQIKKRLEATNDWVDKPDPTDPTKSIKIDTERAELKLIADYFIAKILGEAFKNLTTENPDTLAKLYPVAEDAKAKFEWTAAKYNNFGATILDEVNDKNRMAALKNFNAGTLKRTFRHLYPVNASSLKTTDGRKKLRGQLKALFSLEEPFEHADIVRESDAIKKLLTGTSAPAAGTKEAENLDELSQLLDSLTAAGKPEVPETDTTPTVAAVGAGPFPSKESIEALFADVTPVSPEDFVKDFRELDVPAEIAAYIRGYKSSTFRGHYPYLVSAKRLDALIKSGTPEELNLAKKQIIEFSGLTVLRVDAETIADALVDFRTKWESVKDDFPGVEEKAQYEALGKDFDAIATCLVEDRLEALFDKDNPYVNFFTQLGKANDPNRLVAFLNKFEWMALLDSFDYMRMPMKIESTDDKDQLKQAKKQLVSLTGVNRNIKPTLAEVKANAEKVAERLNAFISVAQLKKMAPVAHDNMVSMLETLGKMKADLKQEHLDKMYE